MNAEAMEPIMTVPHTEADAPPWRSLWRSLGPHEQLRAATAFARMLFSPPPDRADHDGWLRYRDDFIDAMARRVHFRPQTLKRMPLERFGAMLVRVAEAMLVAPDWRGLFHAYYFDCKRPLMARFLDLCGIPNDDGLVQEVLDPPEDAAEPVARLVEEYGEEEVRRYLSILLLMDRNTWGFVEPALRKLAAESAGARDTDSVEGEASAVEPAVAQDEEGTSAVGVAASDEFTQLDRVVIDQILATVAGEDRALDPDELVDFVEGVLALDASRGRTYFHLGMLDWLLPGRGPAWDRPELNDRRRGWYLAGLLAAAVRQRDAEEVKRLLEEHHGDFDRAAVSPGGAGATMARTLTVYLAEIGRVGEATALLRGHAEVCGPRLGWELLELASSQLRRGEVAPAKALLTVLHEVEDRLDMRDAQLRRSFQTRVSRKLGQAHQAEGRMTEAKTLFESLHDAGARDPDLLADIGFVEAGFRTITQVRIEGDEERLHSLRSALERGERWFEEAVSVGRDAAVNAHYALAVLNYLRWTDDHDGKDDAQWREIALGHAQTALAGMMGSSRTEAYESAGVVGQCRFIVAACRLGRLEPSEVQPALADWMAIDAQAGRFPARHLRRVFENAQLVDEAAAVRIAETIWRVRKGEALDILGVGDWIVESGEVQEALLALARDERQPRARRFEIWKSLVPAAIRSGRAGIAEEGLDTMEGLAQDDSGIAREFLQWLEDRSHCDPVWDESAVLRARAQILYRLGKDVDAHEVMRRLFFALRERWPEEAVHIREYLEGRGAAGETLRDLVVPAEAVPDSRAEGETDEVDARLAEGERVRVLFVGGNETQARYDDWVQREIAREWPGVSVRFEHTGWGSNVGSEFERLRPLAATSDAVVLMVMMRTTLGQKLRAALNDPPRPWIPCTGTGRKTVLDSVRRAARVGMQQRVRRGQRGMAGCAR